MLRVAHPQSQSGFSFAKLPIVRDFVPQERISLENVLVTLSACALFFTRPTALGDTLTPVGIAATLGLVLLIAAASIISGIKPATVQSSQIWAYALFVIYIGFLIVGGRPYMQDNFAKMVAIDAIGVMLGFTILSSRQRTVVFFDTLAKILILLSASTLITFAMLASGARVGEITIGHFSYSYHAPSGTILFPFSMIYNYAHTWFGLMPRLSGFFREVGIFPAFACWAAGYAFYRRWSFLSVAICLGACVASLSTLGALLALITAGGLIGIRLRLRWWAYVIFGPFLSVLALLVSYSLPYIGIGYKYTTLNTSVSDRMNAMINAADTGNLLFGSDYSGDRNGAINLIAGVSIYGLVGVLLLLAVMLIATRRIQFFVAALLPAMICALISQPIATEPLFLLLFVSWRAFEREKPQGLPSSGTALMAAR